MVARVLLIPAAGDTGALDYAISAPFQSVIRPGVRVLVPLGRKLVSGYIVKLRASLPTDTKLTSTEIKEIQELPDTAPAVTAELLQITQWVAEYYGAPWGEVIKAALPPGIGQARQQRRVRLLEPPAETPANLNTAQQRVWEILQHNVEMSLQELLTVAKVSISPINSLQRKGLVEFFDGPVRRDPLPF